MFGVEPSHSTWHQLYPGKLIKIVLYNVIILDATTLNLEHIFTVSLPTLVFSHLTASGGPGVVHSTLLFPTVSDFQWKNRDSGVTRGTHACLPLRPAYTCGDTRRRSSPASLASILLCGSKEGAERTEKPPRKNRGQGTGNDGR